MKHLWILVKGLAMGAADVVPGVSGGTVAYITGIYQRLLDAIHGIGPKGFKALQSEGIPGLWRAVDGPFLLALGSGIALSILSLSKLVLWGLDTYPQAVWGLFFGLIVGSLPMITKNLPKGLPLGLFPFWSIGIAFGVGLSLLSPSEASLTLPYVFMSGALAICAMILPGISGSFILVLLGVYEGILTALHDRDLPIVLTFMAGACLGLLSFARLLRWLFARYPNAMVSTMAGFIVGSLTKIWPLQASLTQASNALPTPWVFVSMAIGLVIVRTLQRLTKTSNPG